MTEGQTIVILFYLLNSMFGASFWTYEPISGWKLNVIMWLAFLGIGCVMIYNYLRVIIGAHERPNEDNIKHEAGDLSTTYKDLSNRSIMPSRFLPTVPLSMLAMLGFGCHFFSRSRVMENNLVLYHLMFGTVISKLSCLILVSISKWILFYVVNCLLNEAI